MSAGPIRVLSILTAIAAGGLAIYVAPRGSGPTQVLAASARSDTGSGSVRPLPFFYDLYTFRGDGSRTTVVAAFAKIAGEKLVQKYSDTIPSTVIRFAAIFSDWCEHPPLYSMLCTWFSGRWDHRILAGKGNSAIPYLHINDLTQFFHCLVNVESELPRYHVLNASPAFCTSHRELFKTAKAPRTFSLRSRSLKPTCDCVHRVRTRLYLSSGISYALLRNRASTRA